MEIYFSFREIIMNTVEKGLFVSVEYKGTLENGDVFDTSHGRAPLEVKVGAGQLIKGFEDALMGMALNDKKTVTLEPDQAYGHRSEDMVHSFTREEIPAELNPQVGQTVGLTTQDGQQIPAHIVEVTDEQVTVDLNHPMAGKTLTFEIEVVGISETPTQQHAGCNCGADTDCSSGCC